MKEFFLILFFSKSILLTPEPVTFSDEITLTPGEELNAITAGASVQIDLSAHAPEANLESSGLLASKALLEKLIPKDGVSAYLLDKKGTKTSLTDSSYSISKSGAWLILSSNLGVPTNGQFKKVVIRSNTALQNVKIYWRNYKQ